VSRTDVIQLLYIVAFSLFIYGLMGLTGPRPAVRGNRIAAVGMAIAVIATLLIPGMGNWGLIALGVVIGTAVGIPAARQVRMTAMPQMVALFNGVGGGAVALIAWVEFRHTGGFAEEPTYVAIFSLFAAIVGSVSFWGSNIAFAKLQELLPGRPITVGPGRTQQALNALLLVAAVACATAIVAGSDAEILMICLLLAAAVLGNFVVLPIGGADMPVVISLLNSFTGTAAAMAGFVLGNPVLIISGALVGASGAILTKLMADAMNRSVMNIMVGGFGGGDEAAGAAAAGGGTVREIGADDVAIQLAYAQSVIIVPGYGLAVAQAQHAVRELAELLESKGVDVKYAIHPVAGRMPGHMNVLLAEANVPYPQLKEMDEINPEFDRADVALVIGANDVTNPAARRPGSPVSGMPILDVDHAKSIVVIKRSMGRGYAGIDNELYADPKTGMLFADAKDGLAALTAAVKAL
jgi:H+-translocating NAD(P) transhydrogenase subunit beta